MTDAERQRALMLSRALRCTSTPNGDCIGEACPYYIEEEVPEDMAREIGRVKWPSCDVDRISMEAATLLEHLAESEKQ